MKRLLCTLVAWGAVLLPMAAHAQRGMGFHGSSAPARASSGFAGRPASFAARPAGFAGRPAPMGRVAPAGMRTMPMRVATRQGRTVIASPRTFNSRSFTTFPRHVHVNHFHVDHFHHNHVFFGTNCFNGFAGAFPCTSPFLNTGFFPFYDPFYSSYDSYAYQPQPQPVAEEEEDDRDTRDLALQVQELSDEIQSMRNEDRVREERRNSGAKPAQDDGPSATLIFRDGLQLAVKNYAVSGDTIWVLDDHNTRKVPLSKIDIAATQKINDQNGVEIHLTR